MFARSDIVISIQNLGHGSHQPLTFNLDANLDARGDEDPKYCSQVKRSMWEGMSTRSSRCGRSSAIGHPHPTMPSPLKRKRGEATHGDDVEKYSNTLAIELQARRRVRTLQYDYAEKIHEASSRLVPFRQCRSRLVERGRTDVVCISQTDPCALRARDLQIRTRRLAGEERHAFQKV